MPLTSRTIKLLDFDKILEMVSGFAKSDTSKQKIMSFAPDFDLKTAQAMQDETQEAVLVRGKYLISPVTAIDNIADIVSKTRVGVTLTMGELLKVARVLKAAAYLKEKLLSVGEDIVILKRRVANLYVDTALAKDIENSIIGENEMSDNASFKLKSIRRTLANLSARLKEKLVGYTKNNAASEYLQDNLYTVRNNRFVLPVKSERRGSVPGLIHDRSASGATVFVEPFELVDLNNDLQTAQAEEQAEIERILAEFSSRVYDGLDALIADENAIIMSDIVFAKAGFGEKYRGIKPFLNITGKTQIEKARHPLIDADKVVPVSPELGKEFSILLITGPNTGGKTVCMKTVGLFCLMAYSGIPLPCEKADIAVYDEILCDIGDEQSISNELSTFSSHVVNINRIINRMTNKSLVLFDELGGGTDPTEGAALALGIIKYLEVVGCSAIISTHYDKLKEYALTAAKVRNACMLFDEQTLQPTYKLVIGMPGSSNALKIAKGLGMNEFILKEAEKNLDADKIAYENIIRSAEEIKAVAEREKESAIRERRMLREKTAALEAEKIKAEALYEKIRGNAAAEVKRIVSLRVAEAEKIIEEMKALSDEADEKALLEARIKRNKLSDLAYKLSADKRDEYEDLPDEMVRVGQKVIVKSLGAEAVITQLPDKKGEVRVRSGNIATKVRRDDLATAPEPVISSKKASKPSLSPSAPPKSGLTKEIMVIGQTVAEAIETVEPYIIAAHSSPDKTLRIVHGKGTMALAHGIQAYLKKMPLVQSFRYGKYGEGDNGVTIVTVR